MGLIKVLCAIRAALPDKAVFRAMESMVQEIQGKRVKKRQELEKIGFELLYKYFGR